jgi:glucokinase
MAVIGPGTGLGVAGLVRSGTGWTAVSGEGGHATLAPGDERESGILRLARRRFDHVSAERLLSGTGLPLLHELVAEVDGRPAGAAPASTADIVAGALAGDAACNATVDVFCGWLGSFAGNVALCFGARGGVYLGGGILPRLGGLLDRSAFRSRFEAKGRSTGYLAAVPTRVILCPAPALRGAARMAAAIPDTSAR